MLLYDSLLARPSLPIKCKLHENRDLVFFITAMSLEPNAAHGTAQALNQNGINNNANTKAMLTTGQACYKGFIHINLFNLHNGSWRYLLILSPFYR